MSGGGEISILGLIGQATVVVQLVMLLLAAASVYSWTIIFQKAQLLKTAQSDAKRFETLLDDGLYR